MTKTPWIKLFALGTTVWMVFGAPAVSVSLAIGFGVLFALLDAAMAEEDRAEKREDRAPRPLMTEVVKMVRLLFSRRVGPFYLTLAALTWAGLEARHGDREKGRRGWTAAEAGGAHQPGSQSGLCACGKPLGHDKAGASTSPEATKRIEALKKRTMSAAPSVPAANLPGIGPNAKPLPPGLVPNANVKLPPGIAPAAQSGGQRAKGEEPEVRATEPQTPSPMPQAPSSAPQPQAPSPMLQAPRLVAGSAARRLPHAIISPSGVTTSFYYDLLGRKITATKAPGTPEAATTTHQYDAVGNETATLSPVGIKTTHSYDARRRRISTTDAINRTWTFTYTDTAGPSGAPPCCGADPTSNSRAATTIHPDGTRDEKIYNALGQLIETRDANVTAKADQKSEVSGQKSEVHGIRYAYDEDGRLTTLTDARGSVTKWRYDARGKLQSKTYPDTTVEAYEHDAAGQLVSRLRPNGVTASYTYSPRGKLLTIRWSDGKTEPSTFAYDAAGNMILAENHSAKITRTHTPEGRLLKETQQINYATVLPPGSTPQAPSPFVAEVGYQYNEHGQLAQLTYPDQSAVSYHYNQRGELDEVQDSRLENQKSKIVNHKYNYTRRADGKITSLSMPNGTTTQKSYDLVGRLAEIMHAAPDKSVLFSEASTYDQRNRRTARQHADGSTDLFAYDPAGQVTAAAYGQSSTSFQPAAPSPSAAANATPSPTPQAPGFTPSQTFAYDPAGNRTQSTESASTITYQANEANQYTQITTGSAILEPQFDPNGNLLVDSQNTYTWDADIHLRSVETKIPTQKSQISHFRYDALHRRVARYESETNTTTLFVMDGWNVVSEYTPTLKSEIHDLKLPRLRLVWSEDLSGSMQGAGGIGGLLSTANDETKTANWFHFDSNGNVTRLSGTNGKESARYQYDAFGKTILAEGASATSNHYQFSTKPIENRNGLAYYGFRFYSPKIGRWPSRDPIGEYGSVNLYASCNNDLIGIVDIKGLAIVEVVGRILDAGLDLLQENCQPITQWIDSEWIDCQTCCRIFTVTRAGLNYGEYLADLALAAELSASTGVGGFLYYAAANFMLAYNMKELGEDDTQCNTSCSKVSSASCNRL